MRLASLLAQRILVLDGALGTMLPGTINKDALVLSDPDTITHIHDAYLAAGADIIKTNTFRSTSIAQSPFGLADCAYELNRAAARLARGAAEAWSQRTPHRPRFVAGVIGPARAPSRDVVVDAYQEQVRGLMDGGVDLLLVETIVDTHMVSAVREAIGRASDTAGVPMHVMMSATVDRDGRLPSGETLEAFVAAVHGGHPLSIGLNCAHGAREIGPHIAELSRLAGGSVSCHPNAGLPDAAGRYAEGPQETAAILCELAREGIVNIVGGCCGTTPEHTKALAEAVAG